MGQVVRLCELGGYRVQDVEAVDLGLHAAPEHAAKIAGPHPEPAHLLVRQRPYHMVTDSDGEEGKFTERPVKLGPPMGDAIQVVEGLKPGEKVVTDGSFLLRAEAARTRG